MTPVLNPDTLNDESRPTVFISYSRENQELAYRLVNDLHNAGLACWIDEQRINYGEHKWYTMLAEGINHSYVFVPLVSRQALLSDWVSKEIFWAVEEKKSIIPLMLEDVIRDPLFFLLRPCLRVSLFDCPYETAFAELLRKLPPPSLPVSLTDDPQRKIELAYLEGLRAEEKLSSLEKKYTTLSGAAECFTRRVEMRTQFELLSLDDEAERQQPAVTEPFEDAIAKIRELKQAVLLGEPGGGKTTTLWKLAAELVAEALAERARPLPLLIRLKRWNDAAPHDLMAFIKTEIGALGASLDALLRERRVALLLDGLNELPTAERRDKYAQVKNFIEAHPGLLAVVSCRAQDYSPHYPFDLQFDRINVRPLDALGIREFATKYLEDETSSAALFWQLAGPETQQQHQHFVQKFAAQLTDPERVFWTATQLPQGLHWGYEWRDQSQEKDNSYWQQWLKLRETPASLMVLARNPYMLLMLVSVYARDQQLPANRGGLFRRFVRELIEREHRREAIPADEQKRLSEKLALVAYEMQINRAHKDDGNALTALPKAKALALLGERLLTLACSASLLSLGEQVSFTHQLLQEYFAAQYMDIAIRDEGLQAASIWKPETWWERKNWEEASVLLAGLASNDCTEVLEWLAAANPEVAAQCIVRSGAHTPDATREALRERWLKRLTDLKNDKSPLARAAVGRALGLANLDNRKGVSLIKRNGIDLPRLEFIKIPAGEFQYGHKDESDNPPQTISLNQFYISRFPVTVAQFQTFIDDAEGARQPRWYEGLTAKDDDREIREPYFKYFNHAYANHPRETVNWYQAVAFSRWLAWRYELPPDELRLPTEFEWEKAARGTDGRLYPYKGKFDATKSNVDDTGINQTSAVGIFPHGASPYGVEEMSGNVWEWCLSAYENPAREAKDEDLNTEQRRVLRGGAWFRNGGLARAVVRFSYSPGVRFNYAGFRLVVVRPPSFLL